MNVIAPGLIDAKCSEDTHAWGQEGKINNISLVFICIHINFMLILVMLFYFNVQ